MNIPFMLAPEQYIKECSRYTNSRLCRIKIIGALCEENVALLPKYNV